MRFFAAPSRPARPTADGSIDQWLEAIIEGEAEDLIAASGWRQCRVPRRCLRAGRCLQPLRQG